MPQPAAAGTTTPARSAPSDAPGAASSGAAGKTGRHMTPPATAPSSDTSPSSFPTPSGRRPDLTATQRMAGAAVTGTAAHRAEREALDSKPPSAISHYVLTQDVR